MTDNTNSGSNNQGSRQQQGGSQQSGSSQQQQQRGASQQGGASQSRQGGQLQSTQQRQSNALTQRSGGMPIRRMPSGTQLMWSGSPFALMRSMVRDMDRFVDDVWFNRPVPASVEGGLDLLDQQGMGMWLPEIEMSKQDGNILVTADLPGMNRDDINLEVRDGNLIISGERQQSNEQQDRQGFYRSERRYGSFERVIPLPEGADPAHATARFDNGVLQVTVPVPQESVGGQKIKVE
jgi:HSP20 family protein